MSKEALSKYTKYQSEIKNRLESKEVPAKHVNREVSYRNFLRNELATVTKQLESAKNDALAGKK